MVSACSKYKITSSATKKMTVNQNYYTVVNFIKDGGGDQYDEIQYWAVADMQDGSENKVINFTVSKILSKKIKKPGQFCLRKWAIMWMNSGFCRVSLKTIKSQKRSKRGVFLIARKNAL